MCTDEPLSDEISADIDIGEVYNSILLGIKCKITMTFTFTEPPHTDLLGLLRGALAHKSKAKQQIRLLLLPNSQASGIHFGTDEE